eukprot:GHVT01048831.1.p1 GENE.GHVT01048831.1~~GHVT01048831.1.p1  ORF type:complete len:804 (-),score=83.44 GHVT01048831.1:418-2829(-)
MLQAFPTASSGDHLSTPTRPPALPSVIAPLAVTNSASPSYVETRARSTVHSSGRSSSASVAFPRSPSAFSCGYATPTIGLLPVEGEHNDGLLDLEASPTPFRADLVKSSDISDNSHATPVDVARFSAGAAHCLDEYRAPVTPTVPGDQTSPLTRKDACGPMFFGAPRWSHSVNLENDLLTDRTPKPTCTLPFSHVDAAAADGGAPPSPRAPSVPPPSPGEEPGPEVEGATYYLPGLKLWTHGGITQTNTNENSSVDQWGSKCNELTAVTGGSRSPTEWAGVRRRVVIGKPRGSGLALDVDLDEANEDEDDNEENQFVVLPRSLSTISKSDFPQIPRSSVRVAMPWPPRKKERIRAYPEPRVTRSKAKSYTAVIPSVADGEEQVSSLQSATTTGTAGNVGSSSSDACKTEHDSLTTLVSLTTKKFPIVAATKNGSSNRTSAPNDSILPSSFVRPRDSFGKFCSPPYLPDTSSSASSSTVLRQPYQCYGPEKQGRRATKNSSSQIAAGGRDSATLFVYSRHHSSRQSLLSRSGPAPMDEEKPKGVHSITSTSYGLLPDLTECVGADVRSFVQQVVHGKVPESGAAGEIQLPDALLEKYERRLLIELPDRDGVTSQGKVRKLNPIADDGAWLPHVHPKNQEIRVRVRFRGAMRIKTWRLQDTEGSRTPVQAMLFLYMWVKTGRQIHNVTKRSKMSVHPGDDSSFSQRFLTDYPNMIPVLVSTILADWAASAPQIPCVRNPKTGKLSGKCSASSSFITGGKSPHRRCTAAGSDGSAVAHSLGRGAQQISIEAECKCREAHLFPSKLG